MSKLLPPPSDDDDDRCGDEEEAELGSSSSSSETDEYSATATRLATAQSQRRGGGEGGRSRSRKEDPEGNGRCGDDDDDNNEFGGAFQFRGGQSKNQRQQHSPHQNRSQRSDSLFRTPSDSDTTPDVECLRGPEMGKGRKDQQKSSAQTANESEPDTPTAVNATSDAGSAVVKKKKKKAKKVLMNLSLSKYNVIRQLAEEFGFNIDPDEEVEKFDFNFLWSDTILPLQKLVRIANWQRVNHFPSMHLLCRKGQLALTLNKMKKAFPTHFAFAPRTWPLRSERSQFAKYLSQAGGRKTFICKPNAGCQGKGIILTKDPLATVEDLDHYIVQEYVQKPLLIEQKKFDLRVYVLVTCVRSLSVFVYHDGLVRMCAEVYEKPNEDNMANGCKHLTNYAVNKHSDQFVFNSDGARGDTGNKRDFFFFNQWLSDQGHDPKAMWDRIHHMIAKTIIAAQPKLQHVYNSCFPHHNDGFSCFELLGFDIMIDEKLKPWLLEVNHTPSFQCDTPLDHRIKHGVLSETWRIVNPSQADKTRHMERERAQFAKRMAARRGGGGTTAAASEQQQNNSDPDGDDLDAPLFDWNEVIKGEDSRVKNFTRILPSPDRGKSALYEEMLKTARELANITTTASQETKDREAKTEREKREAERARKDALNMANHPPGAASRSRGDQLSNSASVVVGSPTGVLHSRENVHSASTRRAGGGEPSSSLGPSEQPQQQHSKSPMSLLHHNQHPDWERRTNNNNTDGASSNQTGGSSTSRGPRPPKEQGGTTSPSSVPHTATTANSAGRSSSNTVAQQQQQSVLQQQQQNAPDQLQRLRDRLGEQMEKHRRRMIMGPRLSVFQLREAQLDAAEELARRKEEEEMQQHQSCSGSGIPNPHQREEAPIIAPNVRRLYDQQQQDRREKEYVLRAQMNANKLAEQQQQQHHPPQLEALPPPIPVTTANQQQQQQHYGYVLPSGGSHQQQQQRSTAAPASSDVARDRCQGQQSSARQSSVVEFTDVHGQKRLRTRSLSKSASNPNYGGGAMLLAPHQQQQQQQQGNNYQRGAGGSGASANNFHFYDVPPKGATGE